MYLVFTRMPSAVSVDNSGLCRCVPCLWSAIDFPLKKENRKEERDGEGRKTEGKKERKKERRGKQTKKERQEQQEEVEKRESR